MAQSLSAYHEGSRWQSMEIGFKGDKVEDCKTCSACQIMCPVDIDPREQSNLKVGQFYGCFNCGECIDACKFVHDFKGQGGLLSFKNPGIKRPEALPKA
jgi:flavoprotein